MPDPLIVAAPVVCVESIPLDIEHARALLRGASDASLLAGCDERERAERLAKLLGAELFGRLGVFALPADFRLSVVIPCYNEAATLDETLRRVCCCGIPLEILVVDDGSDDATAAILREWQSRAWNASVCFQVLTHATNLGKGAALKTGFLAATGAVALVQDADLEYDPTDYWRLIRPIVAGEADGVFGSRFRGGGGRGPHFWHALGNRAITWLSNRCTGLALSDMETCYKAFRRELIANIAPTLAEKRFGVEPELAAKVARVAGARIAEVPIRYSSRTYAEGKKIRWRDGWRALYCVVRYWWAP